MNKQVIKLFILAFGLLSNTYLLGAGEFSGGGFIGNTSGMGYTVDLNTSESVEQFFVTPAVFEQIKSTSVKSIIDVEFNGTRKLMSIGFVRNNSMELVDFMNNKFKFNKDVTGFSDCTIKKRLFHYTQIVCE